MEALIFCPVLGLRATEQLQANPEREAWVPEQRHPLEGVFRDEAVTSASPVELGLFCRVSLAPFFFLC